MKNKRLFKAATKLGYISDEMAAMEEVLDMLAEREQGNVNALLRDLAERIKNNLLDLGDELEQIANE